MKVAAGSRRRRAICWVSVLAIAAYILTGVYIVDPDEQVVVRRFGAAWGAPRLPGPHVGLPLGLDARDRVKPGELKLVPLGGADLSGGVPGRGRAHLLTADRNLVSVEATIQYTVDEAREYLFGAVSVDAVLARAGDALLAQNVARQPVDHLLAAGKRELAVDVESALGRLVKRYGLGVRIRSVDVRAVEPPGEVADAFERVISALRERDQLVNEAEAAAGRTVEQARGRAQEELDGAKAGRDERVLEARGEASRFESLLAEYRRAPRLTATRLYLEAMGAVLPRLGRKIVVEAEEGVDLSIFGAPQAR